MLTLKRQIYFHNKILNKITSTPQKQIASLACSWNISFIEKTWKLACSWNLSFLICLRNLLALSNTRSSSTCYQKGGSCLKLFVQKLQFQTFIEFCMKFLNLSHKLSSYSGAFFTEFTLNLLSIGSWEFITFSITFLNLHFLPAHTSSVPLMSILPTNFLL